MTAEQVSEDGALRPALAALEDAVHALCGTQHEYLESKLISTPSLYLQLMDAVTGEQVNTGGGGGSKSRPPLWLNALKVLQEIDLALEVWQPAFTGVPATVGRMHWLLQRKWRPQDVERIKQLTANLREWVADIDQLLNPPRVSTIAAPCPACGVETVSRRDDMGENVRVPALQIVTEKGCTCQACRYTWTPEYYLHLCRVLGFDLPSGVLE
jgi:hypothetical protein